MSAQNYQIRYSNGSVQFFGNMKQLVRGLSNNVDKLSFVGPDGTRLIIRRRTKNSTPNQVKSTAIILEYWNGEKYVPLVF